MSTFGQRLGKDVISKRAATRDSFITVRVGSQPEPYNAPHCVTSLPTTLDLLC